MTDNEGGISGNTLFITATDNSGGCISNCITVDNILMTYRVRSARINGYVDILDENSQGVKNAEVIALWRLPDGSSIEQTVNSGKKSRARFTLTADTGGVYTLTVLHVNKAGFSFDADNSNMLHGMIDVAP